MKKRFIVLIAMLVIVPLVLYLWWSQALKPVDPTDKIPINFTIEKGEDSRTISDKLFKANLIRSPVAFYLLSRFGGYGKKIQAGEFHLMPSMTMNEIANSLTTGTMDVRITIPEGWRREEIALKLAKELNIPETEFLKVAKEGYLFPETYQVQKEATVSTIIAMFQNEFNKKLTSDIRSKAQNRKLTLDQLVTIASLVEREGKHDSDRPIIASIIINRLKQNQKLDIDATVQYALGYQANQKSWWKKDLTLDDINIDSPFNTYKNPGLPPTPICNPGIASIQAVVDAPNTEYLYYISDSNGTIHPAKTIEEHNANIAKYLNK